MTQKSGVSMVIRISARLLPPERGHVVTGDGVAGRREAGGDLNAIGVSRDGDRRRVEGDGQPVGAVAARVTSGIDVPVLRSTIEGRGGSADVGAEAASGSSGSARSCP
jgi:hypothetical protein